MGSDCWWCRKISPVFNIHLKFTGRIFIEQYNAYFCLFSVQRLSHEHKPINISKYIIAFRCCLFVSRVKDVEIAFGIFRSKDFFGLNPSLNRN